MERRAPSLQVNRDRLVLVEGKDEVTLFGALIDHRHAEIGSGIQIVDVRGEEKFPANLRAIQTMIPSRPTFRSMCVVRDGDDNPDGAFQSA